MAKSSQPKPTAPKGKPQSTVTKPIEGGDPMPEQDEAQFTPPEQEDIEALAIQMALGAGERKPRATLGGVPRWKQWEGPARDMLVAFNFITERKSK